MKIITFDKQKNFKTFEWAYKTAFLKTNHTIDSWKKRSKVQRFMDIFLGDLAKNIIADHVRKQSFLNKNLVEYDQIREDNFKFHDKFDLKINDKIIEVKSSAEIYSNDLEYIYNHRRMIVNKNNIHEKPSDILVQVFFVHKDINFFKNISNGNYNNLNIKNFTNQIMLNFVENTKIMLPGYFIHSDIKNQIKLFKVKSNI